MDIDKDKIDDVVLAFLWMTLHGEDAAWRGFDWDTTDRLCKKGMIGNAASKSKSLYLTDEGLERSKRLFQELFTRSPQQFAIPPHPCSVPDSPYLIVTVRRD